MEKIQQVQQQALDQIEACTDLQQLQQIRITTLGKKGSISSLMTMMKDLPATEKPAFGQQVNDCKKTVSAALEKKQTLLEKEALDRQLQQEKIDITLPGTALRSGTLHPLTLVRQEIEDLFIGMSWISITLNGPTFRQIIRQEICRIRFISIRRFCFGRIRRRFRCGSWKRRRDGCRSR